MPAPPGAARLARCSRSGDHASGVRAWRPGSSGSVKGIPDPDAILDHDPLGAPPGHKVDGPEFGATSYTAAVGH